MSGRKSQVEHRPQRLAWPAIGAPPGFHARSAFSAFRISKQIAKADIIFTEFDAKELTFSKGSDPTACPCIDKFKEALHLTADHSPLPSDNLEKPLIRHSSKPS